MLKRESTIDEILEFFKDYEMDLKKYEYMSEEDLAEHLKNLKHVIFDADTIKLLDSRSEISDKMYFLNNETDLGDTDVKIQITPELMIKNKNENECQKLKGKENGRSGYKTKPMDKRDFQEDSVESRKFQEEAYGEIVLKRQAISQMWGVKLSYINTDMGLILVSSR